MALQLPATSGLFSLRQHEKGAEKGRFSFAVGASLQQRQWCVVGPSLARLSPRGNWRINRASCSCLVLASFICRPLDERRPAACRETRAPLWLCALVKGASLVTEDGQLAARELLSASSVVREQCPIYSSTSHVFNVFRPQTDTAAETVVWLPRTSSERAEQRETRLKLEPEVGERGKNNNKNGSKDGSKNKSLFGAWSLA